MTTSTSEPRSPVKDSGLAIPPKTTPEKTSSSSSILSSACQVFKDGVSQLVALHEKVSFDIHSCPISTPSQLAEKVSAPFVNGTVIAVASSYFEQAKDPQMWQTVASTVQEKGSQFFSRENLFALKETALQNADTIYVAAGIGAIDGLLNAAIARRIENPIKWLPVRVAVFSAAVLGFWAASHAAERAATVYGHENDWGQDLETVANTGMAVFAGRIVWKGVGLIYKCTLGPVVNLGWNSLFGRKVTKEKVA